MYIYIDIYIDIYKISSNSSSRLSSIYCHDSQQVHQNNINTIPYAINGGVSSFIYSFIHLFNVRINLEASVPAKVEVVVGGKTWIIVLPA